MFVRRREQWANKQGDYSPWWCYERKKEDRCDFLGGPVIKTARFRCRFDPCSGDCHLQTACMRAESFHSNPILCDPMDWSSPGSSVHKVKVKVDQSCLTLCNPLGLYHPWSSPGQDTGVGSLSFLQGIFPTQGSNPGLGFFTSWVTRAWHGQKKKEKEQGECDWKEQL